MLLSVGLLLAPFAVCFAVKDRALERDRPYQRKKRQQQFQTIWCYMQARLETFNQQPCSPESCHSVALGRVLLLLKLACVILQKGHCSNLIFGAEHIGFLDSKKWSSPVQVDVCAILPAFRGFIVSGELFKQLGAFRVSSRENSKLTQNGLEPHQTKEPHKSTGLPPTQRHCKSINFKLTREAVC